MKKVVVVLSGGLDSTVLLYKHLHESDEVRAISIDYGQRHVYELEFARTTCGRLQVPYKIANLSGLRHILPGSSQTDTKVPVPEGHYAEETMKATIVPNRNMILLSVALGHAIAHKYDGVSYAAHAGDHAIYPDCREEFIEPLSRAARLADWQPVEIFRPFVNLSKAEIVKMGAALDVPFGNTYSCYKGQVLHCGRCGTCVERREAFYLAGVEDVTAYEDDRPIQDVLAELQQQSSK